MSSERIEPPFDSRPYYADEWATIYHGDARELVPHLSADVVLTDLPYGVGVDYDGYTDTTTELDDLIAATLPTMRAAAPVVALTCGIGNVWRYPPADWVLCWHQVSGPSATGRWGFNAWQPVLVYGTDPYLRRGRGRHPDVILTSATTEALYVRRSHPCPKPINAWRSVLARVSPDVTDVVLDPFMGSGTTVVAAKYTGRRTIGIEQSERYCELAATRLAQTVLDLEWPVVDA